MVSRSTINKNLLHRARRTCIRFFFAFHLCALGWFLIQIDTTSKQYVAYHSPWFEQIHEKLFQWKEKIGSHFLPHLLETYIIEASIYQRWWLYAHPLLNQEWITVRAVQRKLPTREYERGDLYRSFDGELQERLFTTVGAFLRSESMAFQFVSGNDNTALAIFAEYWDRVYAQEHAGRHPLAIDVILHEGTVPPSAKVTEEVLWSFASAAPSAASAAAADEEAL